MTVVLNLTSEAAQRVEQAKGRGVDVDAVMSRLVLEQWPELETKQEGIGSTLSPEMLDTLLDELAGGPPEPSDKPVLTYSRADIYFDHD